MSEYVGLDVSLEGTSVCILDDSGRVMLERTVVTDPESIARLIRAKARRVNRVGLETGQLSVWRCHELRRLGVHLQAWRPLLTNVALRGRQRSNDTRQVMVPAQGMGPQIEQAGWSKEKSRGSWPSFCTVSGPTVRSSGGRVAEATMI
jgi:hypothetical protein